MMVYDHLDDPNGKTEGEPIYEPALNQVDCSQELHLSKLPVAYEVYISCHITKE
jgi:hypothetical protein